MSVTDDIKARLDIVSYISQFVPLKKSGRYYKANCPFHGEKTPSFVVYDDKQNWRCFGACADGGDIFTFAMKYHGWDFKEALHELGKAAGIEVRQQSPEQKQRSERGDFLRGLLDTAAAAYHDKIYDEKDAGAVAALHYARDKRGLTDETIRAFGIGYAPPGWDNMITYLTELGYSAEDVIEAGLALKSERTGKVYDRFRHRFIVPIRDRRGRVVGFGGRILDPDDTPKYLNSPQSLVFDKSELLFGLDVAAASIRDTETAVIVEGYMDVITAHQAGFRNVVAQMGTSMTEMQLKLIAPKWARHIVLALDSDAAGQNATRRSLEVARETLTADYAGRMQVDIRVLHIPDAKDPDDLIRETPEQWASLVENAKTVADFVIDMEMADLPANAGIQDKEALARRLMPLLMATENNLIQQENVQKLAMRLVLPERDLLRIAQEEAKKPRIRPPKLDGLPPPPRQYGGEPPPRDYDDVPPSGNGEEPPPREFDDVPAAQKPSRKTAKQPPSRRTETKIEAHLLNGLFQYPDVYYRLNRKLMELAANDERLIHGPLATFGMDDFSDDDLRGLMALFLEALHQDEMDLQTYVLAHVDNSLQDILEQVLVDKMQAKFDDPAAVAPGDFERIMARIQQAGLLVHPQADLMAQALRLRCRRLNREREELRLLQKSAVADGEHEHADACASRIDLLARAVHLLEVEEKQVARLY